MLTLVTGKPGSGKTLFTISQLLKLSEDSPDRPIYYYNIPGLTLDWFEITDPEKWHELPNGSIIVMDEAQKVFPKRGPQKGTPPAHISEFETHRHSGFDVFLMTQDQMLIDFPVRIMVGRHFHVKRAYGVEKATIHQWEDLGDPKDFRSMQEARKIQFKYPKDLYGVYKSSDVHTVKNDVPWLKVSMLPLGVIAAVGSLWFGYNSVVSEPEPVEQTVPVYDEQAIVNNVVGQLRPYLDSARPNLYQRQVWTPEIADIPFSAEFYDALVEPVTMPKVNGCMHIDYGDRQDCSCNTQQGTKISMSYETCLHYMDAGWFDFTSPDDGEESSDPMELDNTNPVPNLWDDANSATASAG